MMILTAIISMPMMRPVPIAKAVKAEKLAFLTDVEGVYRDSERQVQPDFSELTCGGCRGIDF